MPKSDQYMTSNSFATNRADKTLPLIVLKNLVVLPEATLPIYVDRPHASNVVQLLHGYNMEINKNELEPSRFVLLTTQKDSSIENPEIDDLYDVGILAEFAHTRILPQRQNVIFVKALERVKLSEIKLVKIEDKEIFVAAHDFIPYIELENGAPIQRIAKEIFEEFKAYIKNNRKIDPELLQFSSYIESHPLSLISIIFSHINGSVAEKQAILEENDPYKMAESILYLLKKEQVTSKVAQKLQQRVKQQIEKSQKEAFLAEQLKAIQSEMETSLEKSEFLEIEKKISELKHHPEAQEKATNELKKLRMMNPYSSEAAVIRAYLETLLGMPWDKNDNAHFDVRKTEEVLDRDHYGLQKVKERITEYVSVLARADKLKGPILCFIGPPGVGKTSLVKSIAEAMGRKYIKFSLGGVKDESEIRGHRRTYLGSMPGKIISSIKKVGSNNPVMLLDEIDKLSSDYRGDPASALLEVLDPEQNNQFQDHYLEVPYDLSNVVFIATANSYNLPRPLLDRMEIINISGYIEEEKVQIAKNYLIPKQIKAHSVQESEFTLTDEALLDVIRYYTKESGVRSLEREISSLIRKALTKILKNPTITSVKIDVQDLESYLGVRKYHFGVADQQNQIGLTTGLAYTEVGGDLISIEAVQFHGKGTIKATGKLGDVMKESTEAAYSCFLSKAAELGVKEEAYKEKDIHLHVPEGATPKDGPSAGIAIYTTIVSLMTNTPVNKNVAMTGEITLHGKVLPIGGLKEKLLAARRGNIKTVLIPQDNVKDLKDIPDNIKNMLNIIPVSNVDQVLSNALVKN
jgi:ATP-dependent Lon protease